MIETVFPNKILIKDFDRSEEWTQEVLGILTAIYHSEYADVSQDDAVPVFTEENIKTYPILKELKDMFIDSFYELASAYSNNQLTRENIEEIVGMDIGKLPFMKSGDWKRVHSHALADAFAIFYLDNVDNERDGGRLVLHDPSFSPLANFTEEKIYEVETKKNRMVVCPNRIWHEVTPYYGNKMRTLIVVNLNSGRPFFSDR